MKKQSMTNNTPKQEHPFRCPNCAFFNTCGLCDHRDTDGWCLLHKGYVDRRKAACSDFT